MEYEIRATAAFGLEAVLKRELEAMNIKVFKVENGHVHFMGDERDIVKANIYLRTADRILINFKSFKAESFEQLFDGIYDIDWQDIIPYDANFTVQGRSHKSKLFSVSDCQRICEKAIIKKMQVYHNIEHFEKSGARYKFEIVLRDDVASICLDTSGEALHKRGYREAHVDAPIKETMAAGLVLLSYYKKDRPFLDPFCGSLTIPIEALMIARNVAPGIYRKFDAMNFSFINRDIWKDERKTALSLIDYSSKVYIDASDISRKSVAIAMRNLDNLGFNDDIRIFNKDFRKVDIKNNYGIMITNPPYGSRLKKEELKILYTDLGNKIRDLNTWSIYIISSYEDIERDFKRKADRKRKLYNGNIKTYYYQFYGEKPQK